MKRIINLLTALALIIGIISVMPISFAEGVGFGSVAAPTDGKEYILVWNKNLSDNLGDKLVLTADGNGVKAVKVTDNDLANGNVADESKWILEAVSNGVWSIKNVASGAYLCYDASASDNLNKITFASQKLDDKTTSWTLKSGSVSNQFLPLNDGGVKLRYSVGNNDFMIRYDDNNSWVWLYEEGAEACSEHTYSSCTATVCDKCNVQTRDRNDLSHTYSSDDDTECDKCGYVRHIFDKIETNENTTVKEFVAVFEDNGYDSIPYNDYKHLFNITAMVAAVAPLEDVTHINVTVEADNVEKFSNANGAAPSCQLFWNGWWNTLVETKQFGSKTKITYSADVDPEVVQSIWLLPFAFTPEVEISFRITVEVSYTDGSAAVDYGDPLASIVSFSDYQLWGSDTASNNGDGLISQINDIFNTMRKVEPDYFIFGGDYGCSNSTEGSNHGRSQVLKLVSDMWSHISPENNNYIQVEGNHDNSGINGFVPTGGYEYDNFIVYILNEDDMPWGMYDTSNKTICQNTAEKITQYMNSLIERGETRPVIITSHTGLHYDVARTDGNNRYAYIVFEAINEAAKDLDIIFMFGHNHSTGDPEIGGSIAFKTVGDTIYVSTEDCYDASGKGLMTSKNLGDPNTLNFTYMTYGYIGHVGNRYSDVEALEDLDPATALTISELNIYEDKVTVTVYSAGGRMSSFSQEFARKNVVEIVEEPENVVEVENDSSADTTVESPDGENGAPAIVFVAIGAVIIGAIVVIVVLKAKKKQ